MYNALGATAILVLFQFQNFTEGVKKILPILLIGVFFLILIFPFINNFTGGKLEERFEDTEPTHRIDIIESDFQISSVFPLESMSSLTCCLL